jgi:hypothetical protein
LHKNNHFPNNRGVVIFFEYVPETIMEGEIKWIRTDSKENMTRLSL